MPCLDGQVQLHMDTIVIMERYSLEEEILPAYMKLVSVMAKGTQLDAASTWKIASSSSLEKGKK